MVIVYAVKGRYFGDSLERTRLPSASTSVPSVDKHSLFLLLVQSFMPARREGDDLEVGRSSFSAFVDCGEKWADVG